MFEFHEWFRVGQEGCDKELGAQAQPKAVEGTGMCEARLEMARLPLRSELAPKDVRAIQAEEMALHTMRILRCGA